MSDQKLISPLLDGFTLGNPMSSRSGVRCYPAIKENTDKKYIVKVISIPASQVQLDALLLTGAYKDPGEAMDYFKEQTDGIVAEAEILQKLSRLEGFLPYEGWQVEPMENGLLGYRIFLVSSFKRTLDKFMHRTPVTHLQAVNLGLDLCAALAICRRAGLMYVDLKPTNIFMSEGKEYRIGDLGFVKLDALQFTSLPEKYVSPYSAPELHDAMNSLNETADTYALGMLLYQIYNDGNLPFKDKAPAEILPTPCNADYEIAEIIMKAVAPNPADRWNDPLEMGKALAAYLQRNSVNNTPISTTVEPIVVPDPQSEEAETPVNEQAEPAAAEEALPEEEKVPAAVAAAPAPAPIPAPIPLPPEPEKTEEEKAEEEQLFDFDLEGIDLRSYDEIPAEEPREETEAAPDSTPKEPKKKPKWLGLVIAALVLALLGAGLFWGYENYYLQTIEAMQVEGDMHELVVTLDTDIQEQLLTVSCTDTYGNTLSSAVTDGKAVFTDLKPGTQYRLDVQIEGFHSLTGYTSQYFTTSNITQIVSFTAVTGAEDGSVQLTFTVDGADSNEWVVTYETEGEEKRSQSFTGHSVTVRELTVGSTYTFTLVGSEDLNITGNTSLEFTASRLVLASNLRILGCVNGDLTVTWDAPTDVEVTGWTVRCFSEDGDQHMVTTESSTAVVSGIDTTKAFTVEVIAGGMTQAARTSVTANPLTITDLQVSEEDQEALTFTWEFEGEAPEGGWLLMYSMDGSDYQNVIKCDTPSAVIAPRVHGAHYRIEIRSADGISIFDNIVDYVAPNATIFEDYALPADSITTNLLVTPEMEDWTYRIVSEADFTTTFSLGQPISILLKAHKEFSVPRDEVNILYVIRDGHSNVIPELIGQETMTWWDMWVDTDHHYCELDLPNVPEKAGDYTLALYFNGKAIMAIEFTITE